MCTNVHRMLSRSFRLARQTRFLSAGRRLLSDHLVDLNKKGATKLSEVTGPDGSLIGPGAKEGTIPTNMDQATGLERFEMLGKKEGVDVFNIDPVLEGKGTMDDPYIVPTYVGYRYVACRGREDDLKPYWMKVEVGRPARCWTSGCVYVAKYVGEPGHSHH